MERPNFTFRQAQAAFDLISVLQSYDDMILSRVGGDALIETVRGSSCRFENASNSRCYEVIASAALDALPDADIAIGVLAANELQKGLWSGDTKEFAKAALERLRSAPNNLRSAILRGLDVLEDLEPRWEPVEYLISDASRLTRPADKILQRLRNIARGMDRWTRESVAAADYGYRAEEHLRALNDVLATDDCLFPKDGTSFPSEVVCLVACVRDTPGFVRCTALLLANAIPTIDEKGWFPFNWENLGPDYNALPDNVRLAILAGIRNLYEIDNEFLSYSKTVSWDPVKNPERMIGFVQLPEDVN